MYKHKVAVDTKSKIMTFPDGLIEALTFFQLCLLILVFITRDMQSKNRFKWKYIQEF